MKMSPALKTTTPPKTVHPHRLEAGGLAAAAAANVTAPARQNLPRPVRRPELVLD